jgi:hypothetical protein
MRGLSVEPDCSKSLGPFWQCLEEAVDWCVPRANPSSAYDCLRSLDLERCEPQDYKELVSRIAALRRLGIMPFQATPKGDFAGGRLMVYWPDLNLADGAAEIESDGYLDEWNAPPRDTWVAYVHDHRTRHSNKAKYLVAWVPPTFVDHVCKGIAVNPEECIRWLDNSNARFARAIFPQA